MSAMFQEILLHKFSGEKNVSINIKTEHRMYKYQIEGLRFLFKHWKLSNDNLCKQTSNYCVLSSPENGKSVTVVLFLYSICMLLREPILILCKDDEEVQKWVLLFQNWTGFVLDEISVNPEKALINNKKICIKNYTDMSNWSSFIRHNWSIAVVMGDDCVSLPRFHQVNFTIWITRTDFHKNLILLKSFHNWILPKVEFIMHPEIKPQWKNVILVNSVIRNNVFIHSHVKNQDKLPSTSTLNCKRLKNKDTTGLKVKRTKTTKTDCNERVDDKCFIKNAKLMTSTINELDIIDDTVHRDYVTNTNDDVNIGLKESSNLIEYKKDSNIDTKQTCAEDINDDKLADKREDDGDKVKDFEEKIATENVSNLTTDVTIKHEVNKTSDLDCKLNEMQEIAMKKFKGSFLDRIF